jgi:hypothetical protein
MNLTTVSKETTMNQEALAKRDELAHIYQLGELLESVAPRPFWPGNWRIQMGFYTTLFPMLSFLIASIYAGITSVEGAFIWVVLALFKHDYHTQSGQVFIYTNGFICLLRSQQFVARWEHLGEIEIKPGSRGAEPWLSIQLINGNVLQLDSTWMDVKALEFFIESARYGRPRPWQVEDRQGTSYYHPPQSSHL